MPGRNVTAMAPPVLAEEAVDISKLFARPAPSTPAAAPAVAPSPALAPARAPALAPAPAPAAAPAPSRAIAAAHSADFLAEVERQAGDRRSGNELDPHTRERNARLTHAACRAAADYWAHLVDHLNVLRPTAPGRYAFDGRTVLAGATAQDFGVVPRLRHTHGSGEQFESVTLAWRVGNGQTLRVVKDFPTDIERLRARLSFAGINAFESQLRHKQTARLLGTLFEFTAEVVASVQITPLPEQGRVRLSLRNLDALERIDAELPAFAIRANELDELARWICGKPHKLLKHAQSVVRHEP